MRRVKKVTTIGIIFFPIILFAVCKETTTYEITTGSKTGTYYQIGKNLAKYVAPDACIKLKVINSNGSIDNVKRLISPKYGQLKFAIVQNDVLQELKRIANEGTGKKQANAKKLVQHLRVIKPLYDEEIHILTKADSPIKNFGDLKGKKIAIGKPQSGTAMTSMLLYKELFGEKIEKYEAQPFDASLKGLVHGKIDAIIKVAGQPVTRLSKKMRKGAEKLIKLIPYDERNSNHNPITSYYTANIYAKNYHWLKEDIPTLTTKAFLVTYNYKNRGTTDKIKRFVESLNNNLPKLQENASKDDNTPHPKWKQVSTECNPPLPGGWQYHFVVNEVCGVTTIPTSMASCSEDDKILGLCE